MGIKLKELARIAGGKLAGDGNLIIESAAPINSAGPRQITFVANNRYAKFLETTAASAVVLSPDQKFDRLPVIFHKDPYFAFALILDILYPESGQGQPGVNPTAVVASSAAIGQGSSVGALSYIGENTIIGENTAIMPKVYLGRNVMLGNNCKIHPGVNLLDDTHIGNNVIVHSGTVIGSDGFGYARHESGIKKVKQVGWVEIGNEVEIGANVTIDRGALGPTRIGNSVKIDNLVQIAHNVEIGDFSIIISQTGISGSTKLGRGVILAGQVGIVGHIELGDGVMVGAKSGIKSSVPSGQNMFGYPAREIGRQKRIEACINRLPELLKRVNQLEKKVNPDQE
nr:UDP-3-O-(3-hydroxymyristoyl)glucosamine N-acyltransferase [candidate division Zixibacteria bacterium]